jgi:predicted porin
MQKDLIDTRTRLAVRAGKRRSLHNSGALLASAIALICAGNASAVEVAGTGDWTLDVGGFVNAYYTTGHCSGDIVNGAALASRGLGCSGEDSRTTIGNGLLPNALVTKFKTSQENYEIGGQISIMVHTATTSSIGANSDVDVRQAFFTIGNADMGTFKLGRDYGIFGSGAILGDMTLLGVGAPTSATQRGRVSLGHIGAGYHYLGHYGQIAYTTPSFDNGFGFTGAVVSPVDNGGDYVSKSYPQLQGQVSYTGGPFKVWAGVKSQRFYAASSAPAGLDDFTMTAGEIGASLTAGKFGLLANIQSGKGLGILDDGDNGDVKSNHWLVQGTFNPTEKLKLGLNYGISKNDDDGALVGAVKSNSNVTAGAYYSLTKSVTLVAELGRTESKDFDGNKAKLNGGSVGGIIFF